LTGGTVEIAVVGGAVDGVAGNVVVDVEDCGEVVEVVGSDELVLDPGTVDVDEVGAVVVEDVPGVDVDVVDEVVLSGVLVVEVVEDVGVVVDAVVVVGFVLEVVVLVVLVDVVEVLVVLDVVSSCVVVVSCDGRYPTEKCEICLPVGCENVIDAAGGLTVT
jgi:hypothetical protein